MANDNLKNHQTARKEAEQEVDPRVDLAVERTELALERTQLAWVRTVFGLYTGGIALDKGLQALHEARMLSGTNWVSTGHAAGIFLAILGTVLSILTTIISFRRSRALAHLKGTRPAFMTPAGFLSAIAGVLGAALSVLMISTA